MKKEAWLGLVYVVATGCTMAVLYSAIGTWQAPTTFFLIMMVWRPLGLKTD